MKNLVEVQKNLNNHQLSIIINPDTLYMTLQSNYRYPQKANMLSRRYAEEQGKRVGM